MNGFTVRKESRAPSYKKSVSPWLVAAVGIAGVFSQSYGADKPCEYKMAGVPVMDWIESKDEMRAVVETVLTNGLKAAFKKDVLLCLTNGRGQVLDFEADGYDPAKKIAFEWVAAPGYTNETRQGLVLTVKELSLITNYLFGSTYILTITGDNRRGISREAAQFAEFYKSLTNNKK